MTLLAQMCITVDFLVVVPSVAMQKTQRSSLYPTRKNRHTKDIFSTKLFQLPVVMRQHSPSAKGRREDVA